MEYQNSLLEMDKRKIAAVDGNKKTTLYYNIIQYNIIFQILLVTIKNKKYLKLALRSRG